MFGKSIFKFLYLQVWKKITYYIGILYNEISQVRSVIEITGVVVLFCAWRHINLTNRQIAVFTVIVGAISVFMGWVLEKSGGPQRSNELSNSINPQMVDIIERLERIEKK